MSLALDMITIDCADPHRLAQWWAGAIGGSPSPIVPGEFRRRATETARHDVGGGFRWVVLADPDGNVFCVAAPRD